MSIINPITLSGFEVLLVETDKKALQHHAYVLFQNSYRVTTTMEISEALSMVINRRTFDCILVDAENGDMDLVEFIRNIWIHQPQMRIVVMTSKDCHMQLGKDNLENDVIWFLRKPIGGNSICNALQQVFSKVLNGGTSTGNPPEENQNGKIVQTVGGMPSPTFINGTMINNNTSSRNGTHQVLNIITQKYHAMWKPTSHVDISSDDDEARTNESIRTRRAESKDKGKKPLELKRKNGPPADTDNHQKRKEINSRVVWTPTPYRNYLEPSTWYGKEGSAYPTAIQNHMNMPDHSRAQIASHLKETEERAYLSMKSPGVPEPMKIKIDNNASTQNSSSIQRATNNNSNGISYMTFDKIMSRGGPQLPLPPPTPTIFYNSGGDQIQPPIGNTFMSNDFVFTGNFHNGGSSFSGDMAPVDRFGIPVESHVTVGGGGEASSSVGSDDVTLPQFVLPGLEDVFHPKPFLGIGEALVGFVNTDAVNIGQASTSVSPPSISGLKINSEEEMQPSENCILPLDGPEGRVIDDDWYLNLIHDIDLDFDL